MADDFAFNPPKKDKGMTRRDFLRKGGSRLVADPDGEIKAHIFKHIPQLRGVGIGLDPRNPLKTNRQLTQDWIDYHKSLTGILKNVRE